jgi:hypothetical protein
VRARAQSRTVPIVSVVQTVTEQKLRGARNKALQAENRQLKAAAIQAFVSEDSQSKPAIN